MPDSSDPNPQLASIPWAHGYSNGFQLGISKTDCNVLFLLGTEPFVQVFLPPSVAKELGEKLLQNVDELEKQTQTKFKRASEIPEIVRATLVRKPS